MPIRIVVTDANILINLIHAQALELLGRLDGYEFVTVDQDDATERTFTDLQTAWERAIKIASHTEE